MTKQQWAADEEKLKAFQVLINTPVMQEALALVRAECLPKVRGVEDPAHITTLYALDHSRAAGWYAGLSMLEALQSAEPRIAKGDPKPWGHKDSEK